MKVLYWFVHPSYYAYSRLRSFVSGIFLLQSHMNKDHAEDTKAIVQHWTSIPVRDEI